ncbi:hypothetical protein NG799_26515 [Laspinema sp. D1]|uniref:Uncharacterized protein n=1 Tax=Laspinema palackyanum D2a TaxID=2953684 RepID=A0ABT2MYQ1_9CYAN|nr:MULTISPECIES: hypothetical protein [unclassified Laspinema]MCT7969874.1 hypothetical protein [Laspinema sp. D2a]MCT7975889.1 hypothetical protein [Laspinema sp. D3d]MCT7996547.1 hypothetical protein [Laspinema sp. D3c]
MSTLKQPTAIERNQAEASELTQRLEKIDAEVAVMESLWAKFSSQEE